MLSIHHVGGRSGSQSFPLLIFFDTDVHNTLYDADACCLKEATDANKHRKAQIVTLPYCLDRKCQKSKLYITYCPFSTSVFKLNDRYKEMTLEVLRYHSHNFEGQCYYDHPLGEAAKVIGERDVSSYSFNYLLEKNPAFIPPDFLSLDTQGSEYEILLGASKILQDHTLVICSEVEFIEIYKNQKLFGDTSKLLAEHGFDFTFFESEQTAYSNKMPIGLRGRKVTAAADAYFFKRPEAIIESTSISSMKKKSNFASYLFLQLFIVFLILLSTV